MLIVALPRLTDEERDLADDEYAVIPAAVPANLSDRRSDRPANGGARRHANSRG